MQLFKSLGFELREDFNWTIAVSRGCWKQSINLKQNYIELLKKPVMPSDIFELEMFLAII